MFWLVVPSQAACYESPWRLMDASSEVDVIAWTSANNLNSFEDNNRVEIRKFYLLLETKTRNRWGLNFEKKRDSNPLPNFVSSKSKSLLPTPGNREFCEICPFYKLSEILYKEPFSARWKIYT